MTGPNGQQRRGFAELSPVVVVAPSVRASAGAPVSVRVLIANRASVPRTMSVTPVGVDSGWLPRPVRTAPVLPGHTIAVDLAFTPAAGTIAAAYPLSIAVQAIDPARRIPTSTTAIAETSLVIDATGQIGVRVEPSESEGYLGRRMAVVIDNNGLEAEDVRLEVKSSELAEVRLRSSRVHVPAGSSVRVPGRIRIEPRMFGARNRWGYTVTARGAAAPRYAEAGVTAKAFFGNNASRFFCIAGLCVMWAAAAIIFIPKLADSIQHSHAARDKATASSAPGGHVPTALGAQTSAKIQLTGSVVGQAPDHVRVGISPTSLVDEAAQGATPIGVDEAAIRTLGKIPAQAVGLSAPSTAAQARATASQPDGSWAIAGVKAPGYYLLVFAKPGYQTQRYVVDSASAAATQPITVALVPGQGRLAGHVYGPGGRPVGAAQVIITDGINSVTTSSNSRGDVGGWAVTGLSTPDSYYVTVSSGGLSTETALARLAAGSASVVNLTLRSGVGSLVGRVVGVNSLGVQAGLGGAQVTATNGTVTRTASTVTASSADGSDIAGRFTLPDLPPGTYTITASADGYLSQSRTVTIPRGTSGLTVPTIALQAATGAITGRLHTAGNVGVNGAGITLTSATNTYKTTTGADGSFRLDGIAPGAYTLTADAYGFLPVVVNVSANAGQTTEIAATALTMKPDIQVANNSITGSVASAISPSGTLSCPAAAVSPSKPCVITISLTDDAGRPILISTTKTGPFTPTLTLQPSPSGPVGYTLYGVTANGSPMAAGQYTITVKAPGFLTAVVHVKVPFTGQAQAPLANLFPTNTLTGTLNALGGGAGLASDGPPDGHQNFTNCVWAFPAAQAPATPPTNCTYTPPATSVCNDSGQPQTGFAVVDASGSYTMRGLCDGAYAVYVVVTNPWYVDDVPPATETFIHGQTLTYSPTVKRLGRVVLTVTGVDLSKTTLTGTASCGGSSHADLADIRNGLLTIEGVPAGRVGCTIDATDNTGVAWSSLPTGVTVSVNQDNPATGQLIRGIWLVVGQLVSPYGASRTNLVANATVTITGDFFADASSTATHQVTTLAPIQIQNSPTGCFVGWVSQSPVPPQLPPGSPCANAPTDTVFGLPGPLASRQLTVAVTGPGLQPTTRTITVSPDGNIVSVDPQPISTTSLQLYANAATDLTAATLTVTPVQAIGAGTVTLSVDKSVDVGNGTQASLTWQDSALGAPNVALPGTYKVTASAPGFTTVSETAICFFNATCSWVQAPTLQPQPAVIAHVAAALGASTQFANANGGNTAFPTQPLAGAAVVAAPCTGSTAATCPSLTAAALPAGTVMGLANSAGQLVASTGSTLRPGYYTMRVSSFGYTPQTYGARNGSTAPVAVSAGGKPAGLTLTQTPVTFKVGIDTGGGALLSCPATNPHCATVTLHRIDTNQADVTTDTQDAGHYCTFAGIDPATYVITVRGTGLRQTSTQYTVPLGDATHQPAPFVMTVSPVQLAAPKAAPAAAAASPHKVSVTVTTTADGDDVAGANVALTSTIDPSTVLTPNPAIGVPRGAGQHGMVDTWTFTTVPAGNWALSITLPATHFGTLTMSSGPSLRCRPGTAAAPAQCTSTTTLAVGAADAVAAYSIDEFQVGLRVASQRLAADPNASPPGTVALSVSDGVATVYANDTFDVDGASPSATFWGAAQTVYTATVAAAGLPSQWRPQPQTYTAGHPAADLLLVELAAPSGVPAQPKPVVPRASAVPQPSPAAS